MQPKTLAALTLTTLALAACGGEQPPPQPPPSVPPPPSTASATPPPVETTPPPPPKPSLTELVPQTLKGVGDAFNAHDAKKVASYYAEDIVVQAYGMPEREGHGRDDVAKATQWVLDLSNDAKSAVTRVWTKGNVAVLEIAWAGTATGDYQGIKASKKPVGQTRVHVVWFNDDGLIKEQHEYGDTVGFIAQLKGAKGAPPAPIVPTSPPEMHAAKGSPEEDKLADWGKSTDEVFSKDDVKAVQIADDADYWMNFGKPATKGKAEMTKELTGWFKAFPDQKWTTTNAWGIDGYAIVEHTVTGTQKGPLGPVPASNKQVMNWHWVDIMQPSADGKLQHGWGFANLAEALLQTGAMKVPTEKPVPVAKADMTKGAAGKSDKADAAKGAAPKSDAPKAEHAKPDTDKEPKKK
jgi:ketosteroid isomerase-like protein